MNELELEYRLRMIELMLSKITTILSYTLGINNKHRINGFSKSSMELLDDMIDKINLNNPNGKGEDLECKTKPV